MACWKRLPRNIQKSRFECPPQNPLPISHISKQPPCSASERLGARQAAQRNLVAWPSTVNMAATAQQTDLDRRLALALKVRNSHLRSMMLSHLRTIKSVLATSQPFSISPLTTTPSDSTLSATSSASLVSLTLPSHQSLSGLSLTPADNYTILSAVTALSLLLPAAKDTVDALSILPPNTTTKEVNSNETSLQQFQAREARERPTQMESSDQSISAAFSLQSLPSLTEDELSPMSVPLSRITAPSPSLAHSSKTVDRNSISSIIPLLKGYQYYNQKQQRKAQEITSSTSDNGALQTRTYYRSVPFFEPRAPTAPWALQPVTKSTSRAYGYNGFRTDGAKKVQVDEVKRIGCECDNVGDRCKKEEGTMRGRRKGDTGMSGESESEEFKNHKIGGREFVLHCGRVVTMRSVW